MEPEASEREREESRRRIEAGGIPLAAERRLQALRDAPGGLYTSDLTVRELAVTRLLDLQPLTQVMGSSFQQVGWMGLPTGWGAGGLVYELQTVAGAYNEARRRALERLDQEARLAGADAVVGVHVSESAHGWENAIEFTAIGTAVRVPGADGRDQPVLTDLSGQEYVQLVRAGFRPLGIAAATSVFAVRASWQTQALNRSWLSSNAELADYTRGVYQAREVALERLTQQGRRLGADGIVGVALDQRQRLDRGENRDTLIVTFHVLGTAIAGGAPAGDFRPRTVVRRNPRRP